MRFIVCHMVASFVAGTIVSLFWIFTSNLGLDLFGDGSGQRFAFVINKAIISILLPIPIALFVFVLTLPLVLIFYGLPERNRKLLSIGAYSLLGAIFPMIMVSPSLVLAYLNDTYVVIDFGELLVVFSFIAAAGIAGGFTFGVLRRQAFSPSWHEKK